MSLVSAQMGIPHQFYGGVGYNSASAPNGMSVVAKIDGVVVKETTTLAGRYGYNPLFFVTDPEEGREGKTIVFYVNGIEASSFVFGNGKTTQLNLAVTGSSGGGGGSGLEEVEEVVVVLQPQQAPQPLQILELGEHKKQKVMALKN
jgi:hypothetical protein